MKCIKNKISCGKVHRIQVNVHKSDNNKMFDLWEYHRKITIIIVMIRRINKFVVRDFHLNLLTAINIGRLIS